MPHGFKLKIFSPRIQRLLGPDPAEGGLLLDAVLEETIGHEALKTAFPIELGTEINDHLIMKPGLYTMIGTVTDHPILWKHTDYQHGDADTRHLSAYAILRDLWIARELFSIETGFLSIETAVLVAFIAKKTPATAHTFTFNAQVDEMVIVQTQELALSPEDVAAGQAEGSLPEADAGPQQLQPVDDRSLLATGADFLGGLIP